MTLLDANLAIDPRSDREGRWGTHLVGPLSPGDALWAGAGDNERGSYSARRSSTSWLNCSGHSNITLLLFSQGPHVAAPPAARRAVAMEQDKRWPVTGHAVVQTCGPVTRVTGHGPRRAGA